MGCFVTSQIAKPKVFSEINTKYHIDIMKDKRLPFLFTEEKNDDHPDQIPILTEFEEEKKDKLDPVLINTTYFKDLQGYRKKPEKIS